MIRTTIAAALAILLFASAASAQTCSVPNQLTNGTTADATQVMANFNAVAGCFGSLRGYLAGVTMSNDTSNPNVVIDTSVGMAESDDATTLMNLAVAFTKNANQAWGSGTGSGCLDSGTSLAAGQWYHLFVIQNPTSGVVDQLCSESATAPTLPSGYTEKRRIGSFKTDASSHILAFSQNGDEFLWNTAPSLRADINGVSLSTTATSYPLASVPAGIVSTAIVNAALSSSSGAVGVLITSTAEPTQTLAGNLTLYTNAAGAAYQGRLYVRADTGENIRAVATGAVTFYAVTVGWVDPRGRFN